MGLPLSMFGTAAAAGGGVSPVDPLLAADWQNWVIGNKGAVDIRTIVSNINTMNSMPLCPWTVEGAPGFLSHGRFSGNGTVAINAWTVGGAPDYLLARVQTLNPAGSVSNSDKSGREIIRISEGVGIAAHYQDGTGLRLSVITEDTPGGTLLYGPLFTISDSAGAFSDCYGDHSLARIDDTHFVAVYSGSTEGKLGLFSFVAATGAFTLEDEIQLTGFGGTVQSDYIASVAANDEGYIAVQYNGRVTTLNGIFISGCKTYIASGNSLTGGGSMALGTSTGNGNSMNFCSSTIASFGGNSRDFFRAQCLEGGADERRCGVATGNEDPTVNGNGHGSVTDFSISNARSFMGSTYLGLNETSGLHLFMLAVKDRSSSQNQNTTYIFSWTGILEASLVTEQNIDNSDYRTTNTDEQGSALVRIDSERVVWSRSSQTLNEINLNVNFQVEP